MVTIVTLLIIAIGITVFALSTRSRRTRARPRRRAPAKAAASTPKPAAMPGGIEKLKCNALFWGVQMDQPGCEAARAILDKQYTFDEAPAMPLEGCDSPTCTCLFRGLLDRRKLHRRAGADRRKEIRFNDKGTSDRRSRKDRRRGGAWNDRSY